MKRGLTFMQKINKKWNVNEAGRLRRAEAEKVKGSRGSHSTNYSSAGHRRFWIICCPVGDGNKRGLYRKDMREGKYQPGLFPGSLVQIYKENTDSAKVQGWRYELSVRGGGGVTWHRC